MTKVSVIIPVYNIQDHLRQCLASVIRQDYSNLEIICVDDGSTDSSLTILKEFANNDPRVHIISQKNAGAGSARNVGLHKASGDYIIFLDSDDWFEPIMISSMLQRAEKTNADITICRSVEFDNRTGKNKPSGWMLKDEYTPGSIFSPEEIPDYLFQFTYGWPWDKLYRANFLRENQLLFPIMKNSEDLVFVYKSLVFSSVIALCPLVLVHHRVCRTVSLSSTRESSPEDFKHALDELEVSLKLTSKYQLYERSFINLKVDYLIWGVTNLQDRNIQRDCYQKLRKKWIPDAGFNNYSSDYYYNKIAFLKMHIVNHMPYELFRFSLDIYKRIKKVILRIF